MLCTIYAYRETDIDEVLQTDVVFVNVSKGQVANADDLRRVFSSDNQKEICLQAIITYTEITHRHLHTHTYIDTVTHTWTQVRMNSMSCSNAMNVDSKIHLQYSSSIYMQQTYKELEIRIKMSREFSFCFIAETSLHCRESTVCEV